MKSLFRLLIIAAVALAALVSCGSGGNNETYSVALFPSEGVTVTSENPVSVKSGGQAVFDIVLGGTVAFRGADAGSYDQKSGKFTVENVLSDMRINFRAEDVGYDTTVNYSYYFKATRNDSSTEKDSSYVRAGTLITVTAGDGSRSFSGWSLGASLLDGGRLLSSERSFTFDASPDTVDENSRLIIYANYTDENAYYYDLNGGEVNRSSKNMSAREYYTATVDGEKVKVSLSERYINQIGCASLFWDDASFVREGYVLKEYNTRPDGSGEGYSLGSKFPMNTADRVLYCIWEKDSSHSDFKYREVRYSYASGVSEKTAPHWKTDGIIITEYTGDDETVVVPEMIDGKYVTAIDTGAFTNKSMETLVLSKYILRVNDGAFRGCSSLETVYYPDGIFIISNDSFDSETYKNLHNFYVNATIAPRNSTGDGAFAKKFARLITNGDKKRVIVFGGSSSRQGLATEYLEALLDSEYTVINFGTTRTTQGYMYLEAMQYYANEEDIILYAPENSIYMMGEGRLYWKTLRDLEGMYNIFRHVDIAGYENVFGAFSEFNRGSDDSAYEKNNNPRYKKVGQTYEQIIENTTDNAYGDLQSDKRKRYCNDDVYYDVYKITLNNRMKSIKEGSWGTADPNEDYNTAPTWCSIDEARYTENMNRAIEAAKSSGAKVYFSFCPVDADKVCEEAIAAGDTWFDKYDSFILETYAFDGILGSCKNYIYAHEYFFDNAFHPNDYGRAIRTYTLYRDLASLLGIGEPHGIRDVGTAFEGCLFEDGDTPKYRVSYLENQ